MSLKGKALKQVLQLMRTQSKMKITIPVVNSTALRRAEYFGHEVCNHIFDTYQYPDAFSAADLVGKIAECKHIESKGQCEFIAAVLRQLAADSSKHNPLLQRVTPTGHKYQVPLFNEH